MPTSKKAAAPALATKKAQAQLRSELNAILKKYGINRSIVAFEVTPAPTAPTAGATTEAVVDCVNPKCPAGTRLKREWVDGSLVCTCV